MFVAAEALVLARLLGPGTYGSYALLAQIAVLLLFVSVGSNAGYVYAYYKSGDPDLDTQYLVGATTQFVVGGLCAAALLAIARPYFLFGATLYFLQIPYFVTEPMLRVRNRFTLAAAAKALSSLITLALVLAWIVAGQPLGLGAAIGLMLAGNVAGCAAYFGIVLRSGGLAIRPRGLLRAIGAPGTWSGYWRNVLRPGLPLNASTIILYVFTNVDRLFIDHYRTPTALSVYSLAWQLSQGVMLTLASMNLVSGIRVGERLSEGSAGLMRELRAQFRVTAAAGVAAFVVAGGAAFVLSRTLYHDYQQLVAITLVLSAGSVTMNVVGSITGLLSFERRATQLNVGYACALIVSILGNVVVITFGLWYGVAVAISSLSLMVVNIWLAGYTRALAREIHGRVPSVQAAASA
jgi:O-antigen/teichoic acid export membrane protein